MENVTTPEVKKSEKNLTALIYGLYAASLLVGITALAAIIMNYIKKKDVAGTFLESHFRWQIRTFWFSLLWAIVGVITSFIAIGWFILVADLIWYIYRIVKGWLRLSDNMPMYSA